jgi:hypothetical protein
VGIKETTKNIEHYPDENNPNLIYWDLPGCGTSNFPRETYLEKIQFDQYDFFLLITASRFTQNDAWLIGQMVQQKKIFYLIRTKIDNDITNQQEDYPGSSEEEILDRVREDCCENLMQQQYPRDRMFLICAKFNSYYKWDFPKLVDSLVEDYPSLLGEAITLSLTINDEKSINKQFEVLRERIWKVALMSAAGGAVPILGVSLALDAALIQNEIKEYKKQFGLDPDSVKKLSEIPGVNEEAIKNELSKLGFDAIVFASVGSYALKILALFATAVATEEFVSLIPIVGWFLASEISFATTYKVLEKALNTAKEASLIILYHILKATTQSSIN